MTTSPAEASPREALPTTPSGPCWVCGGTAMDRVFRDRLDLSSESLAAQFGPYAHADHGPIWLVRCRSCGFGQPEGLPAMPNFFEMIYGQPWWTEALLEGEFAHGQKDTIFRTILAGIGRRRGAGVPRTLLDVGSHVGRFLQLAREDGWEAEGAELNPMPAAFAARRTGAVIHRLPAQELAGRGLRYGAVTLTDVLEHIPHPAPLVAQLRGLLHPGGVLAIKVPHGPAQRVKERLRELLHPGAEARRALLIGVANNYIHVNHFSVASLRLCLERAGFRQVRVTVAAPEHVPASPTRTRAEAGHARLRMAVYRAALAIPGGVRTPLGLNLQAYAVNPAEG